MTRQVIHIHVPRTGGMSMKNWGGHHAESFQALYRFGRTGNLSHFDPSVRWTYTGHTPIGNLLDSGTITREWYDSCLKFAFVRNTWTRLASCFEFHRKTGPRRRRLHLSNGYLLHFCDFIELIVSGGAEKFKPKPWPKFNHKQLEWLKWGVDFVGRFEYMQDDWERVCKLADVPHVPLRKRNSANDDLRWKADYRDYYTDETAEKVAKYWAEEIERFGFTFDGGN